eukprot:gene23312-28301_t
MCHKPGNTTRGNSKPLLTFMVINLILLLAGSKSPEPNRQLALHQGA